MMTEKVAIQPFTQTATITIPTASVAALNATPFTLVVAPGAGLLNVFESAIIFLDFNSVGYAAPDVGADLAVKYTNGAGVIVSTTLESTGFINAVADAYRTLKCLVTDITPVLNAALVLHNVAAVEYVTGNSPLIVKVNYRIITALA